MDTDRAELHALIDALSAEAVGDVMEQVRGRVAEPHAGEHGTDESGAYGVEGADDLFAQGPGGAAVERWLHDEVAPIDEAMVAEPARGVSVRDVRQRLAEERASAR